VVLRILSHFCGFQGLLEVTPIPCGLMEQTRNGPVARLVAGARAALPYGEGVENPEGGTEYPMRAVRNNHAFALESEVDLAHLGFRGPPGHSGRGPRAMMPAPIRAEVRMSRRERPR
jgi:hypothetical protein